MVKKIFTIYLIVIMFALAIALFAVGIFLPVCLAMADNNNWWLLLYIISPMFFLGESILFKLIGEISANVFRS